MKILITGSSGFLGCALVSFFKSRGYDVRKSVRNKTDIRTNEILVDFEREEADLKALENFDAVVHLAGETIMSRWTDEKKRSIYDSRVKGTQFLSRIFTALESPPRVFISASAVGYYGNRGDEPLIEKSSRGEGFLSDVCADWETATAPAETRGVRTLHLRFGAILSSSGGALKQMLLPFRLGLGAIIGTGDQYMSWISLEDAVSGVDFAITDSELKGPVNMVSPDPVTNREFSDTLARAVNRPRFLRIPEKIVSLIFGEIGESLLLSSQRVLPKKLENAHFSFIYPRLEECLKANIHFGSEIRRRF